MTAPLGIRMAAFAFAFRAKGCAQCHRSDSQPCACCQRDGAALAKRAARELAASDPVRVGIADLAALIAERRDLALRLDAADRLLHHIEAATMAASARPWADRVDIHG